MRPPRLRGLALSLLLCASTLALPACRSEQSRFDGHLAKATAYDEQGKNREALIELRNALKLQPKSADVNYRIGMLLQEESKFADAVFYFREAYRLDPSRIDASLMEAKLLLHQDTPRAEQLIQEAFEREPSNAGVHLARSELALVRADTGAALASALTAAELDPKNGLYPMQLGIVQMARIREHRVRGETPPDDLFESAIAAFRKADKLFGSSSVALTYVGQVYASWGGHEKQATEALRAAVEAARSNPDPQRRRHALRAAVGWARSSGDLEFRQWALEQALAFDESDLDTWGELALARDEAGGSGDEVFADLLKKRADDVNAHVRYAGYLARRDRLDEGLAHLEETAKKSVDAPTALERVVAMQLQYGRLDDARQTVTRMKSQYPEERRTTLAEAELAIHEARFADAAPALRKLVGQEESAELQRLLALAEFGLGNLGAATAAVDRAVALAGGGLGAADALRLKARIRHGARDWNLTIQTLQQLNQAGAALDFEERLMLARALYEARRGPQGKLVLDLLLKEPAAPIGAAVEYAVREGRADPDGAYRHLDAALARAPGDPRVLRALVSLDVQAGKAQQALERIQSAAAGGTLSPALLMMRAQIYASQDQLEQAEQDAVRVFAAEPNLPGALDLLISIYAARGKLDEALASFREADRAGALQAGPRVLLARLLLSRGERQQAREMYEKALAERSDLPGAKNDLAYLLAEDGVELDRALALAQEAQQTLGNEPNASDTLGYVYYRKGIHEAAAQQFRYAIELAETSGQPRPEFQLHLGLALRALGQHEDAAAAFEKAIALGADTPPAAEARRELESLRAQARGAAGSS